MYDWTIVTNIIVSNKQKHEFTKEINQTIGMLKRLFLD